MEVRLRVEGCARCESPHQRAGALPHAERPRARRKTQEDVRKRARGHGEASTGEKQRLEKQIEGGGGHACRPIDH